MSDLGEKLARPVETSGGKARATFAQLERRWGFDGDAIRDRVAVSSMGQVENWRRVSGKGPNAVFEKVE